jgi:hypothetical protein
MVQQCPSCGCEITKSLSMLEDEELKAPAPTMRDSPPLLDRLQPPLQPPKEPLSLGIGAVIFFVIFITMASMGYPDTAFNSVLALLAAVGAFSLLKRVYVSRLADWRERVEGASVCLRCWATFK